MRQAEAGKQRGEDLTMPILYFTELLGLAMEVPGVRKCFASHLVDVNSVLDILSRQPVAVGVES